MTRSSGLVQVSARPAPLIRWHEDARDREELRRHPVDGVDLDLSTGEVHSLRRRERRRQVDLMRVLAGFHPDKRGRVLLDGARCASRARARPVPRAWCSSTRS